MTPSAAAKGVSSANANSSLSIFHAARNSSANSPPSHAWLRSPIKPVPSLQFDNAEQTKNASMRFVFFIWTLPRTNSRLLHTRASEGSSRDSYLIVGLFDDRFTLQKEGRKDHPRPGGGVAGLAAGSANIVELAAEVAADLVAELIANLEDDLVGDAGRSHTWSRIRTRTPRHKRSWCG